MLELDLPLVRPVCMGSAWDVSCRRTMAGRCLQTSTVHMSYVCASAVPSPGSPAWVSFNTEASDCPSPGRPGTGSFLGPAGTLS